MSEEKYEDKVINLLKMIAEQTKPMKVEVQKEPPKEIPKSESSEPAEHKHWSAQELLTSSCPECKTEIEKIGKDYMKKNMKERKDLPFICEECGTPVRKEEENCPTCGGKKAKPR